MIRIYYAVSLTLSLLAFSGCTTHSTHLSIPKQEMPGHFQNKTSTSTIANINWRQFFSDAQLLKLMDSAINSNMDLQIALQRIEMSRAGVNFAKGELLPKIDLNIGGSVRRFGRYTMDGAGNASTEITPGQNVPVNLPDMYLGLQSSWEVDIWGKLQNQRKSALAKYFESIEGTHLVISNLVADIAIYYTELVALDSELDILKQTIEMQKKALEVIILQKAAGRATELGVQQFKAQLLNSEVLKKTAQQQIIIKENKINFLLGRYPQPIQRSKSASIKAIPQPIAAGVPSLLLENRPDIRAAEFQIEASKFDLKAAKAAFYPNFNITASLGFQAFNPEFLFTTPASVAYSVIGTLVAPLINRNALEARFNTAKANQLAAMYHYQKTILNAYVEVANQLSSIQTLQQTHHLKKQQSEALQESVDISHELYKSARASYLEILVAQQNALQSKLELIDVTKQLRLSSINVYKALGGGWQ